MNISGSFSRQVGIRLLDSRHSDPKHWEIGLPPREALVRGDLRVLTPDQLGRVKNKMLSIVSSANLPGTKADITFTDKYRPMAPTPGNVALLAKLNEGNRAPAMAEIQALGETVDLSRIPLQGKRTALLIYRLTQ